MKRGERRRAFEGAILGLLRESIEGVPVSLEQTGPGRWRAEAGRHKANLFLDGTVAATTVEFERWLQERLAQAVRS